MNKLLLIAFYALLAILATPGLLVLFCGAVLLLPAAYLVRFERPLE